MHCSEWIGIFSAFFLRVVRATGLPKADTFGRSDPFVQLSVATKRRDDPADDWKEEYGKYMELNGKSSDGKRRGKTSYKLKTLDPVWGEVLGPIRRYNPGLMVKLKATVYDWDKGQAPDFLGHVELWCTPYFYR